MFLYVNGSEASAISYCLIHSVPKNLGPEIIARVVDKFIMQLEAQLADRDVTFELTAAARP